MTSAVPKPSVCPRVVLRGAGWDDDVASVARAAGRDWYVPTLRYIELGFRCTTTNKVTK